jgi:MFS family permease
VASETAEAVGVDSNESHRQGRLRLFGTLCGLVFLINLSRIVFAPLVEPFKLSFGLTAGGAGLVTTLVWLGSALPRLPTGYLLTKVPRHYVVLAAGMVLSGAAAFTATATTPTMLYAGALTMGLASGSYFIAANPLVSELFPDRVGKAIGVHGTASQLAAAGAPLFVGAVLAVADWRAVFWLMSAAGVVVTVGVFVAARRTALPGAGSGDRNLLAAARSQWHIVATGVAIIGVTGFVWNGLFNLYISYLIDAKSVTEPTARTLLSVVFAAGVPAFLLTGRIADRVPYVPLLLSIVGAFVVSVFVLTLVSGLVALAVMSAVIGYVMHSMFPAIDTYLLDSLPDHHRGSAYAVFSATMMLIQSGGSVAVGVLNDPGFGNFGYDAIFQGLAGLLAVVLLVLLVLYRAGRLPTGAHAGGVASE